MARHTITERLNHVECLCKTVVVIIQTLTTHPQSIDYAVSNKRILYLLFAPKSGIDIGPLTV